MQRSQQQLDLNLVEVASLSQRTLLTETSKTWIDLNDDLHFLKRQDAFIWGSDRSGYHHLYLYTLDGKLQRALSAGAWNVDGLLAVDERDESSMWIRTATSCPIVSSMRCVSTAARPERRGASVRRWHARSNSAGKRSTSIRSPIRTRRRRFQCTPRTAAFSPG
jgi:hypothetical protein